MLLMLTVITAGLVSRSDYHSVVLTVLAITLLSGGVACGILGAVNLGTNLTPFPRPVRTGRLVQTGIYRYIRHPLYLSVICSAFGWSAVRASWPALVSAVILALFLDAKARREERWLLQEFPDYQDYARRVARFVPRLY
jgi:protein-S-isoprenylcysteine O-methyltransferase Ste14